jgi:enoyl-CoA hydratase/carnithine racemase
MGLVSKVVDDQAVLDEALAMARHIAGLPPVAIAQVKEVVIQGEDASLAAGLLLERAGVDPGHGRR